MKHRPLRLVLAGVTAGALVAAGTLAGAILTPPSVPTTTPPDSPARPTAEDVLEAAGLPSGRGADAAPADRLPPADAELVPSEFAAVLAGDVKAPSAGRTPAGTFLVGAARASLAPAPELYGATWQTEGCTTYGTEGAPAPEHDHVVPSPDSMRGWPAASPDCIYLGGFGIGPVRPAQGVGAGGVWVRTIAISNGQSTFVYAIADTVGWFARYDASVCPTGDCGILDVREAIAGAIDEPVDNVVAGSTHTHAGGDTYGGWGGIPTWYRHQLRDAAIASAKQAVANLAPATIDVGETHLRTRNNERRDTYFSTVDTGATWLQARQLPTTTCEGKGKRQTCTTTAPVIATWATFGAHPTIVDDAVLHADWPGAAARTFEAEYGGVGLLFEGGLGNASVSGVGGADDQDEAERTGRAIAADIASDVAHNPVRLQSNDLATSVEVVVHPVATNPGIVALASVGLFDREFTPGTKGAGLPSAYTWSKSDGPGATRSCASAGPTVITTAGAHRIGELGVAFAPGEIFSNVAEVVKERADRNQVMMVLGQTNDALGYLIQSFEFDETGNIVTEYGTKTGEYEEVFALDRCLGDHVVDRLLRSTDALGFGG